MRDSRWTRLGPVLASVVVLALLGVTPWGLWERDEGRYADVAREMIATGDFVTPRIDGARFLDKPPLVYWVTAASLWVWGNGETGARFGQVLFAAGVLLATRRIGTLLWNRRRGNIALIVLASSVGFFAASHVLTLDLGLSFFVTLGMAFFLAAGRDGPRARLHGYGMFAALALGVMAKGPIGAILPGMTIACFLALQRDWGRLRSLPWAGGLPLFFAIAAPWYVAVSIANPEFPRYFFLHENLARFGTTVHRHTGPWYYYISILAAGFMPWTLFLPLRMFRHDGARPLDVLRRPAPAFLVSWLGTGLLFFSAAQSKLPLYALPLFPAAALLIAAKVDDDLSRGSVRTMLVWTTSLVVVAGAGAWIYSLRHDEWGFLERYGIGMPIALFVAGLAAAALAAGAFLVRRDRPMAALATAALLWMGASYTIITVVGRVNFFNETKHFASVLRREMCCGEPVFAYQCYLRGLPFYLRQTVGLVTPHADDVRLGATLPADPGTFPGEASFLRLLAGEDRVFAVVREQDLRPLQARVGRTLFILARSGQHDLVSNRLGVDRERELRAALESTGFDVQAALERAARARPGAVVDTFEIERIKGGEPICTVQVTDKGAQLEIHMPMSRPGEVSVEPEFPSEEESGVEDHLLRVVPFDGSAVDLPRVVRAAAGK